MHALELEIGVRDFGWIWGGFGYMWIWFGAGLGLWSWVGLVQFGYVTLALDLGLRL